MSGHPRPGGSKDHSYAMNYENSGGKISGSKRSRSKSLEKSSTSKSHDSKRERTSSNDSSSKNKDKYSRSKSTESHSNKHESKHEKRHSSKSTSNEPKKERTHSSSQSKSQKSYDKKDKTIAKNNDKNEDDSKSSKSSSSKSATKSVNDNSKSSKSSSSKSTTKSSDSKVVNKNEHDNISEPKGEEKLVTNISHKHDDNNNKVQSDSEGLCSDTEPENEAQLLRNIKDRLAQLENRDHAYSFTESDRFIDDSQFHDMKHDSSYAVMSDSSILNTIQNRENKSETLNISHDSEVDFMEIFNEGVEITKKGKPIGKDAKYLVENFFDREPDKDVAKTLKDRYPEPENVQSLSSKDINVEIYRGLDSSVKKRDFVLKNVQGMMCTSSVANLRIVEEVADLYKSKKISQGGANALLKYASDSTKMLARAQSDISLFRKFLMKPHLQYKYQPLCTKRTFGKNLFGDDLAKEIKEIDEESKIMKTVSKTKYKQNRFEPYKPSYAQGQYGQGQTSQRGRGFLSRPYQRGRSSYRARGRGQTTQSSQNKQ